MASEIVIPPAALEAGCSAYTAVIYKGNGTQAEFRDAIRAAFVAMVGAWEGMHMEDESAPWVPRLILPLAAPSGAITENPDDNA